MISFFIYGLKELSFLLIKMTKKMFMSPSLVRRVAGVGVGAAASPLSPVRRKRCEDEMDLILPSPTSEGSGGDFVNNHGNSSNEQQQQEPEIGFSLPKFRSPMPQRVSKDVCHLIYFMFE